MASLAPVEHIPCPVLRYDACRQRWWFDLAGGCDASLTVMAMGATTEATPAGVVLPFLRTSDYDDVDGDGRDPSLASPGHTD